MTEEVVKKISQSRTHHLPLAVILIEIDQFEEMKQIFTSDTLQEILEAVDSLIKTHIRKQDFLLPQGDARFLLILPRTSQRAAVAIAEIIRAEVVSHSFALQPVPLTITLSMGLTAFDTDPARSIYDEFEGYLGKVERALTKAKEKGNTLIALKKKER
jgi:diguanylate cyclase (GGDEF)-like protein